MYIENSMCRYRKNENVQGWVHDGKNIFLNKSSSIVIYMYKYLYTDAFTNYKIFQS